MAVLSLQDHGMLHVYVTCVKQGDVGSTWQIGADCPDQPRQEFKARADHTLLINKG